MKVKYTNELIGLMGVFSRMSGVEVKDCFEYDDSVYFVVNVGSMGRALGKGGSTVRRIQETIKKKVKLVEFDADATKFVKNLVYPHIIDRAKLDGETLVIVSANRPTKGMLIGRNAKNLNMMRDVVQRYFPIKDVRVE